MGTGLESAPAVATLDVGGTHVTAALVETRTWTTVAGSRHRRGLDAKGTAGEIVGTLASALDTLGSMSGRTVGIAMPGPFEYATGIGRFRDVGKFDGLDGVDVRAALTRALDPAPERIVFLNDAVAFALGELRRGVLAGRRRGVAITLGTGVGSAFVAGGRVVTEGIGVPPEGRADLLRIDGAPLEDVVSRRAILARYRRRSARGATDVATLAGLARAGDPGAAESLSTPLTALGRALAPWLADFEAEALVLGGGIAASFDLVAPPLRAGLLRTRPSLAALPIELTTGFEQSVEAGAAWHAITT
ncbi:ROK family protein [Planotetraspora sp. A-T 1434]|uniref:ROK family protein n=1 Tax=Planotetraspora sp. A-T 1434 TaxID=2979219 RepID=UPI0021BEA7B2|nr:ROK family protein [Planotetraspora sp. A-T 1434]MCT9931291.1 ROK family protein [Planotetraspora sp. A-T 1434]